MTPAQRKAFWKQIHEEARARGLNVLDLEEPEQPAQQPTKPARLPGKLINHKEAIAYLDTISDPIVQALIEHAYSQIFAGTPMEFAGEFDLLFFFKILESFLRDRERLAKALTGQTEGHPLVAD